MTKSGKYIRPICHKCKKANTISYLYPVKTGVKARCRWCGHEWYSSSHEAWCFRRQWDKDQVKALKA